MFLADEDIKVWTMSNPEVIQDIEVPSYFSRLFKQEQITLTFWGKFKRRPRFTRQEKLVCVFEGREEFRMVHFMFKDNIQVGEVDELPPDAT